MGGGALCHAANWAGLLMEAPGVPAAVGGVQQSWRAQGGTAYAAQVARWGNALS